MDIRAGVVDVVVVDPGDSPEQWKVLLLRRASGTRCTGAWEVVHGRVDELESPEEAALRELREETGLEPTKLYSLSCSQFYLHKTRSIQLAVCFVAMVHASVPSLSEEHDTSEWLSVGDAIARITWPRSAQAIREAMLLFGRGDAGPAEDVLRVR